MKLIFSCRFSFFLEISELQSLINPSILSKKTATLLKGEILRKFRCILLAKFTTFLFGVVQWIGLYRPLKALHYFFKNTSANILFMGTEYLVLILVQNIILNITFTEI
jgi:hypothetical protein